MTKRSSGSWLKAALRRRAVAGTGWGAKVAQGQGGSGPVREQRKHREWHMNIGLDLSPKGI